MSRKNIMFSIQKNTLHGIGRFMDRTLKTSPNRFMDSCSPIFRSPLQGSSRLPSTYFPIGGASHKPDSAEFAGGALFLQEAKGFKAQNDLTDQARYGGPTHAG